MPFDHSETLSKCLKLIDSGIKFSNFKHRIILVNLTPDSGLTDLVIDFSDYSGRENHPTSIQGLEVFLSLARSHPEVGPIFVKIGVQLYMMNAKKNMWIKGKNAREIWANAKKNGQKFSDVITSS